MTSLAVKFTATIIILAYLSLSQVPFFPNGMKLSDSALLCLEIQSVFRQIVVSVIMPPSQISGHRISSSIALHALLLNAWMYNRQKLVKELLHLLLFSSWQQFYFLIINEWCNKCELTVQDVNRFLLCQTLGGINGATAGEQIFLLNQFPTHSKAALNQS